MPDIICGPPFDFCSLLLVVRRRFRISFIRTKMSTMRTIKRNRTGKIIHQTVVG